MWVDRLDKVESALRSLIRVADRISWREETIQDVLAGKLGAKVRQRVHDIVEADVVTEDLVVEVKLNRRPYEGFLQAALAKMLMGLNEACVVHVVQGTPDENFVKIAETCARLTNIPCFIVDLQGKTIVRIDPNAVSIRTEENLPASTCLA